MNTTQNKAALWKSCVEQGVFDKVPSELQHQVQGLFEMTLKQFNNEGLELGMANQMVLREFKLQLGKLIGHPLPQKSFEEINEEYKGMYAPKLPEKIEFSKEKDTPLEDLDAILKQKSEQRQNEIHEFFKEEQKVGGVLDLSVEPNVANGLSSMGSTDISNGPSMVQPNRHSMGVSGGIPTGLSSGIQDTSIEKEELVLHRRILESILEAQLKIIDMLQRK
jgi:hypothetical protein